MKFNMNFQKTHTLLIPALMDIIAENSVCMEGREVILCLYCLYITTFTSAALAKLSMFQWSIFSQKMIHAWNLQHCVYMSYCRCRWYDQSQRKETRIRPKGLNCAHATENVPNYSYLVFHVIYFTSKSHRISTIS